ncbi:uncharacterized protein J4E92_000745 [Alternaria infectoria]|uniref:uncharacterized protein n=1 Tax=Alternaria infectoria TaxID=45303 RepID=UPI0022207807|nr:uncharacterized protein J4E92_000745 [Alternaria infectoria]KAI4939460.1 hypothetical protein J4E92_000745 [Alternaria infectoria]
MTAREVMTGEHYKNFTLQNSHYYLPNCYWQRISANEEIRASICTQTHYIMEDEIFQSPTDLFAKVTSDVTMLGITLRNLQAEIDKHNEPRPKSPVDRMKDLVGKEKRKREREEKAKALQGRISSAFDEYDRLQEDSVRHGGESVVSPTESAPVRKAIRDYGILIQDLKKKMGMRTDV